MVRHVVSTNLSGNADPMWELEILDDQSGISSGSQTEASDDVQESDPPPSASSPRKKRRRKSAAEKKAEADAIKAARLKKIHEGLAGNTRRWKGFIFIHPECRGFWVKAGRADNDNRRAMGSNSATFGPQIVIRRVELDLGDVDTTTPKQRTKRCKNAENLMRLILRKHHQHHKREVLLIAQPQHVC